jgi:hypothetical protein
MASGKLLSVENAMLHKTLENVDYKDYAVFGFGNNRNDYTYVREWS